MNLKRFVVTATFRPDPKRRASRDNDRFEIMAPDIVAAVEHAAGVVDGELVGIQCEIAADIVVPEKYLALMHAAESARLAIESKGEVK